MPAATPSIARPLARERRVDWRKLLIDLRASGMSLQDVADWLDIGKSTLQGYINEDIPSEPAYWTGHCLIVLWRFRCGGQLDAVPLCDVSPSVSRMLRQMA